MNLPRGLLSLGRLPFLPVARYFNIILAISTFLLVLDTPPPRPRSYYNSFHILELFRSTWYVLKLAHSPFKVAPIWYQTWLYFSDNKRRKLDAYQIRQQNSSEMCAQQPRPRLSRKHYDWCSKVHRYSKCGSINL